MFVSSLPPACTYACASCTVDGGAEEKETDSAPCCWHLKYPVIVLVALLGRSEWGEKLPILPGIPVTVAMAPGPSTFPENPGYKRSLCVKHFSKGERPWGGAPCMAQEDRWQVIMAKSSVQEKSKRSLKRGENKPNTLHRRGK